MEFNILEKHTSIYGSREYAVGETDAMLGRFVEIRDCVVRLAEAKLAPGEFCLLRFGLAPEEYARKDEIIDSLSKEIRWLDDFVELLVRWIPADRLIDCRIINLRGEVVKENVRVVCLRESLDVGAFARKVRKAREEAAQAGEQG